MTNQQIRTKIVVLTPVKNEDWILERFLAVTSRFADHIIVADQNSTDNSREICKSFAKVTLINNTSVEYDEADRQLLLLRAARELVPGPRILLALDADEIMAANAVHLPSWQKMLQADPGTVLCFEKPDLYQSTMQCIRYKEPWPLGYVDDGVEHKPKKIHSIRIPRPDYAKTLHIDNVKVLHYALTCTKRQQSKMRLYTVLENILGTTSSALRRRMTYYSNRDYTNGGNVTASPAEWFTAWEKLGIDMHSENLYEYFWQDFQVLKKFQQYGERRFWADDIWDIDWEECRLYAKNHQMVGIQDSPISVPPIPLRKFLRFEDKIFSAAVKTKRALS